MFKENFIINIKRARKSAKMTQQQVADILNTSRSNITKYDNKHLLNLITDHSYKLDSFL